MVSVNFLASGFGYSCRIKVFASLFFIGFAFAITISTYRNLIPT